ncbi:SDR family NAD(P)-dependent oxidoreductase [Streptomyces xanthophaeus]|uniref:SDR family NAD(P)-dependent oxidoreductase n=1 Tax=Streptomyces xanthophaeus TaxID=67385 RepID=UPI00264A0129|nr:SDR family NAD(P)-dependent oxidoreductase [Streptomyces xanthophaeus]WKD32289.1 SDR family oxidoreductase [Streptomyces xanthophaeus]
MKLRGRTAVVTGGTRGLGREVTEALVSAGATVVVASREAEEGSTRDGVIALKADVTAPDAMSSLLRTVHERYGGPHIVVANAGISRPGPVAALPPDDWYDVINTNLNGVFRTVQAALPYVGAEPGGRIIAMSSLLGSRAMPGAAAYCASKAAIEALVRVCALEVAASGTTVNCVAPGYIDAGMGSALLADERFGPMVAAALASGRPGTGAEVAEAVLFLASAESSYVNGQVLGVDGGVR